MALQAAPGLRLTAKSVVAGASPAGSQLLGLPRSSPQSLSSSFSLSPSLHLFLPTRPISTSPATPAPKFSMRLASKQAYICRDCGYIYNDRTPFEKLPDKYFCPVCGAPKRRFRSYQPAVAKNANDAEVRNARKAEIKRDEAIGRALPVAIIVGVAGLVGLYFYLNNAF